MLTIIFTGKGLQELLKFPTTVFPYNVYKFVPKKVTGFLCDIGKNLQLLWGKTVNVIGKPHNLFRETLVNVIGKQCRWGNTITFIGKGLQELLKFPTTVFPYNVYKFSLKRLWGSPITFTILPITIKDFPCNFIVVSLCIVFPYHFYKYGMYFPRKSLHSFAVYSHLGLTHNLGMFISYQNL